MVATGNGWPGSDSVTPLTDRLDSLSLPVADAPAVKMLVMERSYFAS